MRKVIFQNLISLDGYFEGQDREIDWQNVDNELNEYTLAFLDTVDTMIFGRVTYELMAGYWPTEDAMRNEPETAKKLNKLQKIVFSKSLPSARWSNSTLLRDDIAENVEKLKNSTGKDIAIFGSSDLATALIPSLLIDELNIIINPVILGKSKQLFSGIGGKLDLNLQSTRVFRSGNVLLSYSPLVA